MDNQALKKYSPLGLLALAIVAALVAVSRHNKSLDGDFDVIGYFACIHDEGLKPDLKFVLVREGSSYKKLVYYGNISKGKPTDLSVFSEYPLAYAQEAEEEFHFGTYPGIGFEGFTLNRIGAWLVTNKPETYRCKYGAEGKRLVWQSVMKSYRSIQHTNPKF